MSVNYQEYLASREWGLKKRQVRERAHGHCERCAVAPMEATHHQTYERLGNEELDDLLGVCNPCHSFLNGYSDFDPRAQQLADIDQVAADIEGEGKSIEDILKMGFILGVWTTLDYQDAKAVKGRGAF